MKFNLVRRQLLLATTAVCAASAAGGAWAQGAPQANDQLEEVVVTATRQADTVNRVPLAVSAQTQRNLDQKGIRTIADLQATVPGLRITSSEGSGVATIAIRGVRQSNGTAATTGFYLDETSLQKRNAAGFGSQNGTPIPPLFDLDRVEVLRGPQGTLFGGGSEGGTVRYIQPQPSLTRYSMYARAQAVSTKDGDPSYEGGVAVGGPIVQDKLGFRASVFARKTGGWIDLTNFRNGQVYDENANRGKVRMARLAVTWAPTSNSRITASLFSSRDETHHNSATYNLPVAGTLTVPTVCYDVAAITQLPPSNQARNTPRPVSCASVAGRPGVFTAPGYSIGPLNLKRYQSLGLAPSRTSTDVNVVSLDAQVDITPALTFRSITSYLSDLNKGRQQTTPLNTQINYSGVGGAQYVEGGRTQIIPQGIPYNSNITATIYGPPGIGAYLNPTTRNQRYGLTQEFRLSSAPSSRPVSYVAGIFFSNIRTHVTNDVYDTEQAFLQISGMTTLQRFGVPDQGFFTKIFEYDKDTEIAAFGEATIHFNEQLSAIAGIRVTHITTSFFQANYGPNSFTTSPVGASITGSVTEDPVTPKLGLQYSINSNSLLYATAAKGFRAGGVNQVVSSNGQNTLFGQFGLLPSALPSTYGSDSVWSYEAGGKFRLLNGRAQVNASVYRIDWTNVQVNQALAGDGFVANVPSARSQGAELEGQLRLFRALTLNTAIAWNKGKYNSNYSIQGAPGKPNINVVTNGQLVPLPEWTVDAGARYDVTISSDVRAYARADYRWSKRFFNAPPGNAAYTPDSSIVPAAKNLNLRLGVEFKDFDINVFANNVTNETDGATAGGRSQCLDTACTTFNAFNPFRTITSPTPRQIGIQVAYRH